MVGALTGFTYQRPKKRKAKPGQHTCAHQTRGHFPCAYPSCPSSPAGNFLRLKVVRPDGTRFRAQFKRTRLLEGGEVKFTWRPG